MGDGGGRRRIRKSENENAAKPLPFVGLLFTLVHTIYVSWSNNFVHFILSSDVCVLLFTIFWLDISIVFRSFFSLTLRWFIVTLVHWKRNSVRKCDDNPKPFICNQPHIPWKRHRKKWWKIISSLWFFCVAAVAVVVVCIIGGGVRWRCVRVERTNTSLMDFRTEQRNSIHATWIILQTFFGVAKNRAHISNDAKMEKVNETDFRGKKTHNPRVNESERATNYISKLWTLHVSQCLNSWIGELVYCTKDDDTGIETCAERDDAQIYYYSALCCQPKLKLLLRVVIAKSIYIHFRHSLLWDAFSSEFSHSLSISAIPSRLS